MNLTDLRERGCRTCGEPLDINRAVNGVLRCAVCDSCFTLPKMDASQKMLNFLSQGEHDLDTGKFDDAYTAFNKAAELDSTEPEAYFGMALAEFKIQYLKDEVNNRLQPVCHEMSDKDFGDSANFLKATRYATEPQRAEYERKAEEINYIKNEFHKIEKTGVKYDCFICVKVSAEDGGRTRDYKAADDIYFELKEKGYKPFFSERELIGITGADYEARILYALKSSECMLVICFDEAYLHTKWVKNEYSRFLKLVNDEEKESDSIALVFGDRPVEKLPGKKGKIQGIALNSLTAMERIVQFVDAHTPEAKKRREEELRQEQEQAKKQAQEDEALRSQFAKQAARARQQEERFKQLEAMLTGKPAVVTRFHVDMGDIVGYEGNDTEIIIPEEVDGSEVLGIEEYAFGTSPVRRVVLPKTLVRVNGNAFAKCKSLEFNEFDGARYLGCEGNDYFVLYDVKDPENITRCRLHPRAEIIASCAFQDCSALVHVFLNDGLKRIGDGAFANCAISDIMLPESIEFMSGCFNGSELKSFTLPKNLFTIEDETFENCTKLQKVTLHDDVEKIGYSAFENCTSLDELYLGTGVTEIGGNAFSGCKSLGRIDLTSVNEIGYQAFKDCENLSFVSLGGGIEIIEEGVFENCKSLTSMNLASVKKINDKAFLGCASLESITLSGKLSAVGTGAFDGCKKLKLIEFHGDKKAWKELLKGCMKGTPLGKCKVKIIE